MDALLRKLVESASDARGLVKSLRESGLGFVRGAVGGLPLAGSLLGIASEETERDERHYVLVPISGRPRRFGIYSKRVLPAGQGAVDSLERVRVFHVPDETGVTEIEESLLRRAVREKSGAASSSGAEALERFADEVDREIERISGGLLVVAGTVCAFNPALALGIALPGFLGVFGGKGAKVGLEMLGERVRRRSFEAQRLRIEKDARKEAGRGTTETLVNPLLRALADVLADSRSDYDPFLDETTWADRFESQRHFRIAVEAICEIHAKAETLSKGSALTPQAGPWIRHLQDLRAEWEIRDERR